jgi:hypothetical protein
MNETRKTRQQKPPNQLKHDDRRALALLEEAQRQYERYRELQDVAEAAGQKEPPSLPAPNWQTPLTLVFRSSSR